MSKRMKWILVGAVVVTGAIVAWMVLSKDELPPGFASGNGRLEATDIYVATKYPGRVKEILFDEGDTVEAGQVVARMDTDELEARLKSAQAKVGEAQAQIRVAQADRSYAVSQVAVKDADYTYREKDYARSQGLVTRGAVSEQELEVDRARKLMAEAEVSGAKSQVTQAQSAIEAAKAELAAGEAEIERLQAEIKDSVLVAPIRTRIESRLAEPGEVLPAGGRVFSLLDLSDVYMYVFLPEQVAGKVQLGSEARIVLDAAPSFPIRATVSYVSPEAQFTPKTVETAEERYALSFRVKLQLDKERLKEFEPFVKAGIPGMGYVRFDQGAAWPASLEANAAGPGQLWAPTGASGAK
jgi:HlyD family secretion protein